MGIEEEYIYIVASSVNGTQQIILLLYGYIRLVALKANTALLRTVLLY